MTATGVPAGAASRQALLERRLSGRGMPAAADRIDRAARPATLPLSFGQQQLWVLDQLMPGSAEYAMQVELRLHGQPDTGALGRALTELVRRHEVLRTRYVPVDGRPTQVVDPPAPVPLPTSDLTDLPAGVRAARAAELLVAAESRPFDLATGPVFRAMLVRAAADDHTLVLCVHHIASDGWSEGLLLAELDQLYAAFRAGRPAPLPPVPVQYADFAGWQRSRSAAGAFDGQLDYWRRRLAGLPPLNLPTDRPRPPVRDVTGGQVDFTVPAVVAQPLAQLAREHGTSRFTVLLAALQVLLGRLSGQADVAVGTPVAGRDRTDVQQTVGLFLNTLVLRADLGGRPTFAELLGRVRDAVLDAHANREAPFERVVEQLAPDRDLARNPLFSVMFLFEDEPAAAQTRLGDLAVTRLPTAFAAAKFDLTLWLGERPDQSLAAGLLYAAALFDRATAERVAGQFGRLLAQVAARPDTPLDELDILSDADRRQLLAGWNDTAVDYPTGLCLHELVEAQVHRSPGQVAVVAEDRTLSYAELDAAANRLAHRLRRLGAGPDAPVGVCLHRGADLVVALLAVLKAGAAYLPLDPDHPTDRLRHLLADSAAALVVTSRCTAAALGGPGGPVAVDVADPGLAAEPAHRPARTADPGSAAYLMYTSGSTGRPKGVLVEHAAIVNRIRWMRDQFPLTAADRVLQKTPFGFDVSVWEFFLPLVTGAALVVARPGGHRDPRYLAGLMAGTGVTTVHFVPSMLRAFLAEPDLPALPALRRVVCSGEALDPGLVADAERRFGCELYNLYGPTEAAVDVTWTRCLAGEPVTIGRPVANTRVYVLDADLRPVPVGVPGQLCLAGVQLARGYLHQPALTADRFRPDPFDRHGGGRLYRTGDLARWRADGTVEYLGRLDDQVKVNGNRIELGEVETVLGTHPAVRAAAVAATGPDGRRRLVGYLVPAAGHAAPTPDELRRHLGTRLPEYMIPAAWVVLPELPLTSSGKTDRRALPEPDLHRPAGDAGRTPPRDGTEAAIAGAWADALGVAVDEVGVHDSFFAVGGDSIRAIRMVGTLRAAGLDVSVQDLFTHQTIADLARAATPLAGAAEDAVVRPFELVSAADRAALPPGLVDAYPVAEMQAGMLYEQLADPQMQSYQNVSCYRVVDEVPFDLAALRRAAQVVVDRHEILRTSFHLARYGEPLQLVHPTARVDVAYDDLRGRPADEQRERLEAALRAARHRPFDVSRAPLLRYLVHQTADTEWCLTHIESHAILDGWSQTSVVEQVVSGYREAVGAAPAPPRSLPDVRYADFVAAERAARRSAADRGFWADRLARHGKVELPGGWRAEPGSRERHKVCVPIRDIETRLRRLAADNQVSPKSVLLAAHLKALSVVTGQQRFSTGLVCNGRPERTRGDEVPGMYLNTVPFGADVAAPSWRALLARVFAEETALWPHRRFPLPTMQREWGRGGPLVDTAFGYLDFHVLDFSGAGVTMVSDFSPSELGLEVWTFPGELWLGSGPGRLRRAELELLARVHRHVLETMLAAPDGDPRRCGLPPADRRRELDLARGPAPATEPAAEPAQAVLHGLFERQAARTPAAPALDGPDGTVSYGELNARANRLAHRLRRLGVRPDDVVGLYLPRGPELIVAMLGVLKAGGAYLPLDPDYPAERVRYMLTDVAAGLVLTTARLRPGLPPGAGGQVLLVEAVEAGEAGGAGAGDPGNPVPVVTPDNLAYVIFTSGSTGTPKGAAVPHRGPVHLWHAQRELIPVRPDDRVLQFSSASFDASVWEIWQALGTGAALVLPPADPQQLTAVSHRVTSLTGPPSLLDQWSPADFPRLRICTTGGDAPTAGQVARWAGRGTLLSIYGPTETTVCATTVRVPAAEPVRAPSLGTPIPGARVYLLDPNLEPVPAGATGEVYIGGPGLARGYLNRPALTADRFGPDPHADTPGGRLYRTGDLARRGPDGCLHFAGRVDHQVKVRGIRVELGELETALAGHPAVAAAVVGVWAEAGDQQVVAYVRARPGAAAPTTAQLRAHLARWLPGHMLPTHFVALDELPLGPTGKVDRAALPRPAGTRPDLAQRYVPPGTPTEVVIAAAWRETLGLDRVGVQDDFYHLGGHSLAVMRICALLRERHGIELPARAFVEGRTVAALAARVAGPPARDPAADAAADAAGPAPGAGAVEPVRALLWFRREGSRPPLLCVHPGGGGAHWYRVLAEHLDPQQPVGAFEWVSRADDPAAPDRYEQVAERYLAELREARPAGPYALLSWCGGSGIAGEMVRRLRAAGEQVTFLLLDPAVDIPDREIAWSELALLRRCSRLLDELAEVRSGPRAEPVRAEILSLLDHIVDDVPAEGITLPADGPGTQWPGAVRVWTEVMEACLAYRHRPYPGPLHLIVGDELARGDHEVADGQSYRQYLARWRELATGGLSVHRVDGEHFEVLKPPRVGQVARLVTDLLAAGHPAGHPAGHSTEGALTG